MYQFHKVQLRDEWGATSNYVYEIDLINDHSIYGTLSSMNHVQ